MVSISIHYSIFILLSLTVVNINGRTCHGKSQYDLCSSNNECGCLQLSLSNNVGICAILDLSCSRLQPCQSPGDTCETTDHVCVRHPRCNSSSLCYPLSMIDQRLCPPFSTFSPSTITTPTFLPTLITTEFAPMSILSNYSNALTINSATLPGSKKYYKTINIIVNTSGLYTFTSRSNMDTFAALFMDGFDPLKISLYLVSSINTFDSNRQFKLSHNLKAGTPYTLLVTTHYSEGQTGEFTVIASGPDHLRLF
ncbi:unnamed protein product [Rotaria sordida]|uniref:Uncharacterized protein n=1 Tax=Rotaria sordida TaxID=392033 RepID=A0A814JKB9_9BILA|nr:unnamed protein product [Rotaria sordida]